MQCPVEGIELRLKGLGLELELGLVVGQELGSPKSVCCPCLGQVFACMEISIHPKVYAIVFACLEISIHPKVYTCRAQVNCCMNFFMQVYILEATGQRKRAEPQKQVEPDAVDNSEGRAQV